MHFEKVADGLEVYVSDVAAELALRPELWNANEGRTNPGSPQVGIPDIWLRYRAASELAGADMRAPHVSVFYPAWWELPSLHNIVYALMAKMRATELGGILITKIPPGGIVKPHDDRGSWHAEYMNCKLYIPLAANERCVNHCMDESVVMKVGDCWRFNNLLTHCVVNEGDADRITVILTMRTDYARPD